MPPIQARAGVDHYGHELVQLVRVARIVRLEGVDKIQANIKASRSSGTAIRSTLKRLTIRVPIYVIIHLDSVCKGAVDCALIIGAD